MSTITSTPSVAETLLTSFRATDRKHDLRTAEGKAWKALAHNEDLNVVVGESNRITERGRYDDEGQFVENEYAPVAYEALHVSLRTAESIKDIAELYLREVAPTRTIADENYEKHTIPNTVRVALEWVVLERAIGTWTQVTGTDAYKVASYTIDTDTDEVIEVIEFVNSSHKWRVNPFKVSDWKRDDDTTNNLWKPSELLAKVLNKREAIAEGERRSQLVAEVTEAGVANASYKFTSSRHSVEKFIAKFNEPKGETKSHESYRIRDAFDLASDTAVVVLGEHYLRVLGKTTWEVSSNIISDRRYTHTPENDRPVFIDEVYAYAIVVENFCERNSDVHASIKGEVLGKFTRLIHNW